MSCILDRYFCGLKVTIPLVRDGIVRCHGVALDWYLTGTRFCYRHGYQSFIIPDFIVIFLSLSTRLVITLKIIILLYHSSLFNICS
jgi:hypothetical protein